MRLTHARFKVATFLIAAALVALASKASAEDYPSRTISIVVGTEPGGAPDLIARILGVRLGEKLGQTVIVENRPGAAGTIGAATAARARPDGYTVFLGTVSSNAIAKSVYANLSYDPVSSFTPVGWVASVPLILVVRADSKAHTVADLVELARQQPGKLNYASPGTGGPQHLTTELFKAETKTDFTHIPYKSGSAAVTAVLSGEVDMFFSGMPPALALIQTGKLRALAVTTAERFPSVPDVPTLEQAGLPNFVADNWHALFAPAGTPESNVARLNSELNAILKDPEVREQLLKIGAVAKSSTPAELAQFVKTETDKWARIAKATGLSTN